MPKFQREFENPKYNGGRWVNEWGYVRVSTASGRGKYEHRMVIESLMLEQAIIGILKSVRPPKEQAIEIMSAVLHPPEIPPDVHIHHCDRDRQHNCPGNLMLLDAAIHRAITADHRRFLRRQQVSGMMARFRGISTVQP